MKLRLTDITRTCEETFESPCTMLSQMPRILQVSAPQRWAGFYFRVADDKNEEVPLYQMSFITTWALEEPAG